MSENDLSRKIKDLRAKNKLTLEQIAQQVGVGRSTVRKWETGQIQNMRRDKIAKLAIALHTTPEYLMGWEESPEGMPASIRSPMHMISISPEDEEFLRKFHCLDERGKAAVMNVLNYEYESLPGEKTNALAKEA